MSIDVEIWDHFIHVGASVYDVLTAHPDILALEVREVRQRLRDDFELTDVEIVQRLRSVAYRQAAKDVEAAFRRTEN
jgi:hypothetical protein